MKELSAFCHGLKQGFTPRIHDASRAVRCWSEKDVLNKKIVDAFVIILRTRGCNWALESGCTMCGYFTDSLWSSVSEKELRMQFLNAMKKYAGEPLVKVFTSGSFFDEEEIPARLRIEMLQEFFKTAEKVSVESRPEFLKKKTIKACTDVQSSKVFEVGIGLETANDFIREHAVNKGFTYTDYKKAVDILREYEVKVKTYVLIKPPFLTEKASIEDSVSTVEEIQHQSDMISFNPTNVQRYTLVEYLWKRNQYRPPWLWSIVDVLKRSKQVTKMRLQCDIVGGGSVRGAHNCPACDRRVLDAISQFSLTQNPRLLQDLECTCKEQWRDQIDLEDLSFGSLVDFSGGYR